MSWFSTIYAADVPSRAVTVYMCLKDHANKAGQCFPAINTVARETGLSRSTVKRAIRDLEQTGFLTRSQRWREQGGKSSNLYTVK